MTSRIIIFWKAIDSDNSGISERFSDQSDKFCVKQRKDKASPKLKFLALAVRLFESDGLERLKRAVCRILILTV